MTIAAPSAAIAASGADSNLFQQGAAKETDDPVAAAAMKRPDVVRKRPLGSNRALGENADLSSDLDLAAHPKGRKATRRTRAGRGNRRDKAAHEAALADQKEDKQRER